MLLHQVETLSPEASDLGSLWINLLFGLLEDFCGIILNCLHCLNSFVSNLVLFIVQLTQVSSGIDLQETLKSLDGQCNCAITHLLLQIMEIQMCLSQMDIKTHAVSLSFFVVGFHCYNPPDIKYVLYSELSALTPVISPTTLFLVFTYLHVICVTMQQEKKRILTLQASTTGSALSLMTNRSCKGRSAAQSQTSFQILKWPFFCCGCREKQLSGGRAEASEDFGATRSANQNQTERRHCGENRWHKQGREWGNLRDEAVFWKSC